MSKQKTKVAPQHKDFIGQDINVGDYVACISKGTMTLGLVTKLNPTMVQFKRLHSRYNWYDGELTNRRPTEIVVLGDNAHISFFLLTKETQS